MKRYDVVLGRSGGRPHARCDETPEGAYVRHYVAQRLIDAKQAEIDALKAQNAELLAALTESLAYVEATLSNHDAGCQRHPSTEHARDCILSDLDQIKTAIAKARGES